MFWFSILKVAIQNVRAILVSTMESASSGTRIIRVTAHTPHTEDGTVGEVSVCVCWLCYIYAISIQAQSKTYAFLAKCHPS